MINCAGAQLHVHARRLATVLRIDGEVDASNAELTVAAIGRVSKLKTPLILDLSHLEFLGVAGLRAVLGVNYDHQRARLHCSVVSGPALRRLTRVVGGHGLPIVDSVAEALQVVEDIARARRQFLSGLTRREDPRRATPTAGLLALPS